MADEITINLSITVTNGSFDQTYQFNSTFDQATVGGGNPGVVAVGTSEENIAVGDITTPSLCIFQNLDTTNFVQFGASATTPTMATLCKIAAGQFGFLWLEPTATIRAKADTDSVDVMFWVFEL